MQLTKMSSPRGCTRCYEESMNGLEQETEVELTFGFHTDDSGAAAETN